MRKTIQICTVLLLVFETGAVAHARLRSPSVAVQISSSTVKEVVISGNRRIPGDRIRSELETRAGDLVNLSTVSRDVRALYALGYFDDVQFGTESTSDGLTIVFSVKEKPIVRAIQYKGVHSVTISEIEKVMALSQKGLLPESPYSLSKATETAAALKAILASKGHPEATVGIATQPVPPNALVVAFVVDEGPQQ
jgi:outer membrane protein insertion porin family